MFVSLNALSLICFSHVKIKSLVSSVGGNIPVSDTVAENSID